MPSARIVFARSSPGSSPGIRRIRPDPRGFSELAGAGLRAVELQTERVRKKRRHLGARRRVGRAEVVAAAARRDVAAVESLDPRREGVGAWDVGEYSGA